MTSNTAPGSATMPPASNQESSNATTNPDDDKAMIESEFWELIGTLPGRVDDLSAEQLTGRLASEGPARIINFADILAEKLYAIDHPVGAEQLIRDPTAGPSPMTMGDDLFLYARCAVVAAGKSSWERILNNPAGMAGTWYAFDGEFLLLVAPDAWERVTDTAYTHESPVSYETGSNTDNW